MTPRVSVLVLAYNHGPFLAETLDSILKQRTEFPFEILVGEDCSTDNTLEVAERYRDAHPNVVRLITATSNVGMHENFERLVRSSHGEFLAICEGDDYWNPCDKLARQVAYLNARPGHGAVHGDFDHIALIDGEWRAKRRFWEASGVRVPEGQVFAELVCRNVIQTCTLMVRATLVRDYLDSDFAVRGYRVGDWPLGLFVALHSDIGFIPETLASYRKVEGSATNQGHAADIARARSHVQMATDFCDFAGRMDLELLAHETAMDEVLLKAMLDRDLDEVRSALDWFRRMRIPARSIRGTIGRPLVGTRPGLAVASRMVQRLARFDASAYRFPPADPGGCP